MTIMKNKFEKDNHRVYNKNKNLSRKEDESNHQHSSDSEDADDEISNKHSGEDTDNENELFNAGWADSVSKILKSKKPKGKKCLVLSKAKKLSNVKKSRPKPAGFEIQTADGEVKEEQIEIEIKVKSDEPSKKRRELPKLRVKPDILEKDRERTFQKIATKGVVQLFNAVRMQQKDINQKLKEAGPLEVRKEKVLKNIDKRAFLDVLMGEKSQAVDVHVEHKKDKNFSQDSTWSVLREDFMMGAKMKDWDKELETVELEEELESE